MISHTVSGGIALSKLFICSHLLQVIYCLKIVVLELNASQPSMLSSYLKKTILGFCSLIRKQVAAAGDIVTPADAFHRCLQKYFKSQIIHKQCWF